MFYHGTHASLIPRILGEGFKPSVGAGSPHLMQHYGVTMPGVYVTPLWRTATVYPMSQTTGPIQCDQGFFQHGISGGSLLAVDGTLPMRAVIRCLAHTSARLWHRSDRDNKQSMFMPGDLHITHVYLYPVSPHFVHEHHLLEIPITLKLENVLATPRVETESGDREIEASRPAHRAGASGKWMELRVLNDEKFEFTTCQISDMATKGITNNPKQEKILMEVRGSKCAERSMNQWRTWEHYEH